MTCDELCIDRDAGCEGSDLIPHETRVPFQFSSVGSASPLAVMFKAGDDLRQDHVMLPQSILLMNCVAD